MNKEPLFPRCQSFQLEKRNAHCCPKPKLGGGLGWEWGGSGTSNLLGVREKKG